MNWLRLIRWKNLLIVFLTQLLVWYCLIFNSENPGRLVDGNTFRSLKTLNQNEAILCFLIISFSTVCIAAAGYIINDYFDIKIDIINRPGKVVLENTIQFRKAIMAHSILNGVALIGSGIVSVRAHHLEWVAVQVVSTLLLWFYSTHFKKQFISGNLVVSFLTALSIIVLVIYAPVLHTNWITWEDGTDSRPFELANALIPPVYVCYSYAFFAFMLTWMREIVKDMEDFKGDAEQGCMTMPIKMGLQFSAYFTRLIGVVTLLILAYLSWYLYCHSFAVLGVYTFVCIIAPLVAWCWFVGRKTDKEHYSAASKYLKFIMLSGIFSILIYYFKINLYL